MKSMLTLSLLLAVFTGSSDQIAARSQSAARAQAAVTLAYAAIAPTEVPSLPITPDSSPNGQDVPNLKPAGQRQPIGYAEAYALYQQSRKPMVVMLTARWCPACPATRQRLLSRQQQGELDGASVVVLDIDQQSEMARQIAKAARHTNSSGSFTIPLVVRFDWEGGTQIARRVGAIETLSIPPQGSPAFE
ncbi:TlpA family protein disulfide reductase [Bremerella cremea]|uniref:TlpA family protein disulfide reductase n=1 Tax=Bremerella cremea TaxID=1031537 RepID=UPI0031E7F121